MARRTTAVTSITPTATADTVDLVDATYPFILRGGSDTQINYIWEIKMNGQATSSAPTYMQLAQDSQVGTGSNSLGATQNDAPNNPATAALAAPALVGNTNATLKPRRSSTLLLQDMSFNANGGIQFMKANKIEECYVVIGNVASTGGEVSLSAFTGGTPGAMGCYMVYESM
jgi:hypothetical protein